jgi:hypothetical protein
MLRSCPEVDDVLELSLSLNVDDDVDASSPLTGLPDELGTVLRDCPSNDDKDVDEDTPGTRVLSS